MSPSPTICVTGATGNVGLETIRFLHAHVLHANAANGTEARIIAAVPSPEKARKIIALDKIEYRALDMMNPSAKTLETALHGVERLFLLRPPQISDVSRYIAPLLSAAERAGVQHVVFLSLYGVEQHTRTPHYGVEQLLRKSTLAWTFLRPSFFMQNLTTTHREEIAKRSEIFVPAGNGKTNFIDARDIGEVAALILNSPEAHRNTAYNLTGKHSYTYTEIATILQNELGRPITYTNPSKLHFFWRKCVQERLPISFVLVMIYLYHQTVIGEADGYAPDVERLLEHEPSSFVEFAHRHREMWLPAPKLWHTP
jgi:uncharacterized protein YbjT (DUF2867 family)